MNIENASSNRLTPADAGREAVSRADDEDHTSDSAAEPRPEALHDLPVHFNRSLWGPMLIGGLAGGASGFVVASLNWPRYTMGLLTVAIVVLVGAVVAGRIGCALRRALAALPAPDDDPANPIPGGLTKTLTRFARPMTQSVNMFRQKRSVIREIGHALMRLRGPGQGYRVLDPEREIPQWDPPLDTPIEPIRLSLRSKAFLALLDEEKARRRTWHNMLDELRVYFGKSRFSRGLLYAGIALVGIMLITESIRAVGFLVRGQVPPFWTAFFSPFPALIPLWLWQFWTQENWLLVPGAIIVRTAPWTSRNWTVHLLPRSRSVLLYWREMKMLVIADDEGHAFSRIISRREAEMAFRAWLSPLPPPPREQLTDLEAE